MNHRQAKLKSNREQGVVSILSVMFFIILMSIIAVSFLRIVTDEQTQVIDDDLSKSALASAQSGVEDAKRALLYCRATPSDPDCANLTNQTCPGVFSDTHFHTQLGLNAVGDGSIRVGDTTNNNNQRYTCVTISTETAGYEGASNQEAIEMIPLRSLSAFNEIRFSWSAVNEDPGSPTPVPTAAQVPLGSNPRKPRWENPAGVGYLAVPRLQIFNFDRTQSLSAMRDNSAGLYLYPYTGTGQSVIPAPAPAPPMAISPTALANKHVTVNCDLTPATSAYRCEATIRIVPLNGNQEYYLAVKSVYGPSAYYVELLQDGNPVLLNNVQPEVDSTGASANVYKRIISKVAYHTDDPISTNVLEAGGGVCKDFSVTINSALADTPCLGF